MIDLSREQQDALIEICNIGMSKAAKQLSLLLASKISISIPEIKIFESDFSLTFPNLKESDIFSSVHQLLAHDIDGKALLIFHREEARLLTATVIGKTPTLSEQEIRACEQEAMLEIGNIIISTCMSTIVDMLSLKIDLSIPHYREEKMDELITHDKHSSSGEILIMVTKLESTSNNIIGSLFLILDISSTHRLLGALEKLLESN